MNEHEILQRVSELVKTETFLSSVFYHDDFRHLRSWTVPVLKIDGDTVYSLDAKVIAEDEDRIRFMFIHDEAIHVRTIYRDEEDMEPPQADDVTYFQERYGNADI